MKGSQARAEKVVLRVFARIVAAVYFVTGVAIAVYGDWRVGTATAAFFGSLLVLDPLFAWFDRRPIRIRRNAELFWDPNHLDRDAYRAGRGLSRDDVVGARLVELAQQHVAELGGVDFAHVFFVVDRGFAFELPVWEEPFCSSPLPADAKLLRGRRAQPLLGSAIVDIVRPADEADYLPDDLLVILESGWGLGICSGAPHGTGAAGLHILTPEQIRAASTVSIWS